MKTAAALTLSLMALAGCGGPEGGPQSVYNNCTVTFTGGPGGTHGCSVAGGFDSGENATVITLALTSGSGISTFLWGMLVAGAEAQVKTYANGSESADAALVLSNSKTWTQKYESGGADNLGTSSFKISSVKTVSTNAGGKVYFLTGSLDLTLSPDDGTGATGNVTAKATFN